MKKLVAAGYKKYQKAPCKIETEDIVQNELILIYTNSTQRERTDYERMVEIRRTRELLTEYQKTHKISGRKAEIIANILGTSKSDVGRLENIDKNLINEFKELYAKDKIATSVANKIAGLLPEEQKELYQNYLRDGDIKMAAVLEFIKINASVESATESFEELGQAAVATADAFRQAGQTLEETAAVINEKVKEDSNIAESSEQSVADTVEITMPEDNVDHHHLMINGKINKNYIVCGLPITVLIEFILNGEVFEDKMWSAWQRFTEPEQISELEQYAGIKGSTVQLKTVYMCEYLFTDSCVELNINNELHIIPYFHIAEVINAMYYTRIISVNRPSESIDIQIVLKALKEIIHNHNLLTEQEKCAIVQISNNINEREITDESN